MRLLVYAVLIGIIYFLVKKYAKSFFGPSRTDESRYEKHPVDAEMVQDPHCGAYFLKQRGVKGVVDGKVVHFCSEECYDKYLKRRSRV